MLQYVIFSFQHRDIEYEFNHITFPSMTVGYYLTQTGSEDNISSLCGIVQ